MTRTTQPTLTLDDVLAVQKLVSTYEKNVSRIKTLARATFADVTFQEGSPAYNITVRINSTEILDLIRYIRGQNEYIVKEIQSKYGVDCSNIDQKIRLVP